MIQNKKIAVVAGGTGKTGYYIVKELVERGYSVRLLTRSRDSAKKVLGTLFNSIEDVVVCNLQLEAQALEKKIQQGKFDSIVDIAFQNGPEGQPVDLFISVLGRNNKAEDCRLVEYLSIKMLVKLCEKHKVKKFIFVTAMCMERPFHFIPIILNNMVDNIFHWKQLAEHELRNSELDYIIIRPSGLTGDQKKAGLHKFNIGQGDTLSGRNNISVETVARIALDAFEDKNVPNKVVFECDGACSQKNILPYSWQDSKLVKDSKDKVKFYDHRRAKIIVNSIILGTIVLGLSFLFRKKLF